MGTRVFGLWLPDWPVQAAWCAGAVREQMSSVRWQAAVAEMPVASMMPIALLDNGVVVDCSAAARRTGVRRGQPRRYAQATCPQLVVVDADSARDAQEFEPVLERVEAVAAGVEALRPGLIAVGAKAPTRYYGTEDKALETLLDSVALPGIDCCSGVADDIVTAVLATRRNVHVPPGKSGEFRQTVSLAEVAAEVALDFPAQLLETWHTLGLRTLGDVTAIAARDMATRFGAAGAKWHSIALHGAQEKLAPRAAVADLSVAYRADESLNGLAEDSTEALFRVEEAAFIARGLAVKLHEKLRHHGLSCYRLAVSALFSDGQEVRRVWRCAGPLTESATADRVRWQLDGWLNRRNSSQCGESSENSQGGGIVELYLEPLDLTVAGTVKEALWGGPDDAAERATRAAIRLQGLLGTDAVTCPVEVGGRGPAERVLKIPIGEAAPKTKTKTTWKGALPAPAPSVVSDSTGGSLSAKHPAAKVELLDGNGISVGVTGRATVTSEPKTLRWGHVELPISRWAGPWPIDERWWAPDEAHRAARIQVVTKTEEATRAFLLIGKNGKWRIEGRYD